MPLFHWIPKEMEGTVLHPLNQLKTLYPKTYAAEFAKYDDRPWVPKYRIPTLGNCLWNDVLFLSAVHPRLVYRSLVECGFNPRHFSCYEVNPHLLDPAHTTIWLFEEMDGPPRGFVPYKPYDLDRYSGIPAATYEYLRRMRQSPEGEKPLYFAHIPHIMYKGTLDITGMPEVSSAN